MDEERFEELLRESAREHNRPPATPREEIWASIQEQRRSDRERAHRPRRAGNRGLQMLARLRWWPAAAAAVLVAGILIGRWGWPQRSTRGDPPLAGGPAPTREIGSAEERQWEDRRVALYRHAATPYLSRVEALLTLVRADAPSSPATAPITTWAEELLAETRLLLDSPARQDEELRLLLDDLELVLVQIVRLSDRGQAGDGRWIQDSIRSRSIMVRLRSRIPAGQPGIGV